MKLLFYTSLLIGLLGTSFVSIPSQVDVIPTHDTFTIASKVLHEVRTINIWIPTSYATNNDSLPVLYMADGGIVDEDFPHIANTLEELIKAKKIPPMILVGIQNTQRRRDLTGPTKVKKDKAIAPIVGGSEDFRKFIQEELFPEIASRYRVTAEKSIIGESLSGLFVVETFLLAPDMFDNYIAFDPSLWWNKRYIIDHTKALLNTFPTKPKSIWIAASNAKDITANAAKFSSILTSENISSIRSKYLPAPEENHSTIFRATKEKALIWTFSKP